MPATSRLGFMRDAVRSHPVITASWAATAGILLGTFVTVNVMMPDHRVDKIGPSQAAAEKADAPKPVAETTGAAAAGDGVASAADSCDRQAWPYQSKDCLEAQRGKARPPRVVTTDKIDPVPARADEALPKAQPTPSVAQPQPTSTAISPTSTAPAWAATTATLGPSPTTANAAADVQQAATQPVDPKVTPDRPKRVAKKVSPKTLKQSQPDEASGDDEDRVATSASDGDNATDDRVARGRADPRRRVVRSTSYDVPSEDDRGERRVIVIRRGGGPFETLFGTFGN